MPFYKQFSVKFYRFIFITKVKVDQNLIQGWLGQCKCKQDPNINRKIKELSNKRETATKWEKRGHWKGVKCKYRVKVVNSNAMRMRSLGTLGNSYVYSKSPIHFARCHST